MKEEKEGKELTAEVEELQVYICHRDKGGENFKKKGVIRGIKQAKENNAHGKDMGWPVSDHK